MLTDFESWYMPEPNSGCWIWLGHLFKGYGKYKGKRAHRHSYEEHVGPIPDGLVLDHTCRMRCCVNPAHLEPVTNTENTLRGENFIAIHATKTHCVHGHPLDGANLKIRKGRNGVPYRACRTCMRNTDRRLQKERYWRRKHITDAGRQALSEGERP